MQAVLSYGDKTTRPLVAPHQLDLRCTHQPCNTVFATGYTRFLEVTEDTGADVDAHALVIKLLNLRGQLFIGFSPSEKRLKQPSVIAAAVYFENTAYAGETKLTKLRLHERVLQPDCLSMYPAAFLRGQAPLWFA